MPIDRHGPLVANHTLVKCTDRSGHSLILKRLLVIPVQAVFILGSLHRVGGSMAGYAHHTMVIGPVAIEGIKTRCPAIESGSLESILENVEPRVA